MRLVIGMVVVLGAAGPNAGCGRGTESTMQNSHDSKAASTFWTDAKATPDPIGEGGKSFHPYELRGDLRDRARGLEQPVATLESLLASETDPTWREVLLFLIASIDDPTADDALLRALERPELRPRALYLLGVIGTKGWPSRSRDVPRILTALASHVADRTPYRDVYYRDSTFQVGDFARAAYVRVAGVTSFPGVAQLDGDPDRQQAQFIGLALPLFSDADRTRLDAAIAAHRPK
jgi:hypothetical protein